MREICAAIEALPPRGHVSCPPTPRTARRGAAPGLVQGLAALSGVALMCMSCGEDATTEGPNTPNKVDALGAETSCEGAGCLTCSGQADGTPCDDNDPCTTSDQCAVGSCTGTDTCDCREDGDCAGQEDGDACNGTLYCAKKTMPWSCQVNPATVVTCAKGGPCHAMACLPATGACEKVPTASGAPCDDGQPCTDTACDGLGACTVSKNTCECIDSKDCPALVAPEDLCQGSMYCDQSAEPWTCKVKAASVVNCKTSEAPCRTTACDPATGACVEKVNADLSPCDDGQTCTEGDVCMAGSCASGTWTCPCVDDAQCASQDDGDLCNGVSYCNHSSGKCEPNPASVITCPSVANSACAVAKCLPKTGACVVLTVNEGGACDDGVACTSGESCTKGGCGGGTLVCDCTQDAHCAAKEDGNACNGTLFCDKVNAKCALNPASVVVCPTVDDSECQKSTCDKASGACEMKLSVDGAPCSDGNACSVGDACLSGQCKAGQQLVCPCFVSADCAKFEDGDVCNGTLFCDKSDGVPKCVVNPATVIACTTAFDSACVATKCAPKTGACLKVKSEGGAPCDDGDPCTHKDGCADGLCAGLSYSCDDGDACTADSCVKIKGGCVHETKLCVDGNPCTTDLCDASSGACSHPPVQQPCDDGNVCTQADVCVDSTCKGKALSCDDSNECTQDSCAGPGGCAHALLEGNPCEDGDACTKASCAGGACVGLALPATACDDDVLCTADLCHPAVGCLHLKADGLPCDDGDPCTKPDACAGGICLGKASTQTCDDGNPCTHDGCKTGFGCTHLPAQGQCDDGDPCTGTGICSSGNCTGGADLGCACKSTSDCIGWEDGDACNGTLICDTSAAPYSCKLDPTTVIECDPAAGPCASSACNKATGACETANMVDGTDCSPTGKACVAAKCAAGVCIAKGQLSCDDANSCTLDLCKDDIGCIHDGAQVAGKPCDDGQPCTAGDVCKGGACAPGKAADCGDGNACTLDLCDAKIGCQNYADLLDGKGCDDGNACFAGEVCKGKVCAAGVAVKCDDDNPCTDDGCSALKGCQSAPNAQPCNDADQCTAADVCKGGTCAGTKVLCSDNNPCTVDYCAPAKGCVYDPGPKDGALCVHPSGCVVGAFCNQGSCSGGDASACANLGDCKLQNDSLFMAMGPTVGGSKVRIAADGTAWAVSATHVPPNWFAVRYSDFGTVLATVKTTEPGKGITLRSVLPLSDGGALLGGGVNANSPQHWQNWKSRLRRVDKTGKTLWTNKPGIVNGDIWDMTRQANGTYVLVAQPDPSQRATFVVFNEAGSKVATTTVYKGPVGTYYKDGYYIVRLLAEPAGGFYGVGRLTSPSYDSNSYGHFLIARFNAKGARLWARYIKNGYHAVAADVAITGNVLTMVGYRQPTPGAAYMPWLAQVNKSGTQLASTGFLAGGYARLHSAIDGTPDGGFVLGSYNKAKESEPGWTAEFSRVDAKLNVIWQRKWLPQTSASISPGSIVAVSSGGWRMGGNSSVSANGSSVSSTMVIRTDAWGNTPCEAAGKCQGKKAADCDDGKPCTHDFCEPDEGCVHTAAKGCP